ncbi:hypothetical protein J6590_036886 [Homalodisca vitripennis]|nr:hypothetical protein J6590_036886 [Homalodisca vitripennis]
MYKDPIAVPLVYLKSEDKKIGANNTCWPDRQGTTVWGGGVPGLSPTLSPSLSNTTLVMKKMPKDEESGRCWSRKVASPHETNLFHDHDHDHGGRTG